MRNLLTVDVLAASSNTHEKIMKSENHGNHSSDYNRQFSIDNRLTVAVQQAC